MFQIKICGITTVDDALLAAAAGADAIGLNFYAQSARYVEPAIATAIAQALPAGIWKVGVFVNSPLAEILSIAGRVGLDAVQLHGDEAPAFVGQLRDGLPQRMQIVRAFRCREASLAPLAEYLTECRQIGSPPAAVLLDAFQSGEYGGTGRVVDWQAIARDRASLGTIPIVLAGGLTPENIAAAIAAARPAAVDTASGVESSPGRKDAAKVRAFVERAKAAFDNAR